MKKCYVIGHPDNYQIFYSPGDILNADGTGLYWKCLPDKSLSLKGERSSGGNRSKDRITVLVYANISGSEKLPLLVIGRLQSQGASRMLGPSRFNMKQIKQHGW